MKNLASSILKVMQTVTNIEKKMNVGTGNSSYKAISDSMVRSEIKEAMMENNLVIVPTSVNAKSIVDRWEEETQYGTKSKQSILTEAHTKYLLIHTETGESIELGGYGQGVDSQDKGAGKATTYALKNVLLDTFLVVKGEEMDTDKTHSNDLPVPPKKSVSSNSEQPVSDGLGHLETNDDPLVDYKPKIRR